MSYGQPNGVSQTGSLGILHWSGPNVVITAGHNHPGAYPGEILLDETHHNLLTNMGKNITRDMLGYYPAGLSAVNVLSLANSTSAQVATDVSLQGEYSTCNLGRNAGTFATDTVTGSAGNWTEVYTWTSNCAAANGAIVNATGIYNSTTQSTLFAEATFSSSTLYNGDQIKITWYIWLS